MHKYYQLIFNQGAKTIKWLSNSLFNNWNNWASIGKEISLDLHLSPYTEINSKWILDLNVKHKTKNLLGKSIGQSHCDLVIWGWAKSS